MESPEDPARVEAEFYDEMGEWRLKPAAWEAAPSLVAERKEFWKVFADCLKELPRRLSAALTLREQELPLFQRVLIRMHLFMCKFCARQKRQMLLLSYLLRIYARPLEVSKAPAVLSREAKERLKKSLAAH